MIIMIKCTWLYTQQDVHIDRQVSWFMGCIQMYTDIYIAMAFLYILDRIRYTYKSTCTCNKNWTIV